MKEIKITSNGIKQAIDDLVNENEMLQDKVYKLESIIKEVREYIYRNSFDEERKKIIDELWENEIKDILEILDKE